MVEDGDRVLNDDDESMNHGEEIPSLNGSDEDPWEDERSWRDPSAHKMRLAVVQWVDNRPRLLRGSRVCKTSAQGKATF